MDANAQGGPPTAEIAEVDIEFPAPPAPPAPPGPTQVVEPSAPAQPEQELPPSAAALFASARGDRLKQAAERRIPEHREQPAPPEAPAAAAEAAPEATPSDPTADIPAPSAPVSQAPSDTPEEKVKKTKKKAKKTKANKAETEDKPVPEAVPVEEPSPPPPPPKPTLSPEDAARVEAQLKRDLAATPAQLNPPPRRVNLPEREGETLHEVLLSTKYMLAHIDQLGVFDAAHTGVRLEPSPSGNPDEIELVLSLRERGRLFLKAGTEFGGNEGGGNVTARIRNALGGGEALELNASLGTKTRSAFQASLGVPVLASPYLNFQVSAFSLDRDNTAFASHRELAQGGRLKLAALTPWGNHDLVYEYVSREIGHLQPKASVSIREQAVPSTKASISHSWTSDTRDDPWCATAGRLLKATHEYAGLPGSSEFAHFLKSTTQSQTSRPIFPGSNVFVSVSSFTSLLYPLWKGEGKSYLPDRTFLGGPNSVRGFKVGGLGMSDKTDSLGGDLAYALGVSMIGPIPNKEHWPLKLHTFMNVGKVLRYDQTRNFAENMAKLYTCPSLSVGVGLFYRFDPLRIELNFSMPLIARKGERLARGFSVGMGIEFL
ncbi:hypothetical protein CcaverHIS631_0607520 [Cutaneotrichosporon cavernicola]|nr:hypothetical protein CcaverHIS631_0607520 [Cutaneotrichosporon cavernicola]